MSALTAWPAPRNACKPPHHFDREAQREISGPRSLLEGYLPHGAIPPFACLHVRALSNLCKNPRLFYVATIWSNSACITSLVFRTDENSFKHTARSSILSLSKLATAHNFCPSS